MNRVYQARVSSLRFSEESPLQKKHFSASDLQDQSESPLWEHHTIFQAAINYYLVALASLCGAEAERTQIETRLVKDLRSQIRSSWDNFPRPNGQSLRDSLKGWLNLPDHAPLEKAFETILAGNQSGAKEKTLAFELLLSKCSGDSGIQQNGRGYFPRFCDTNWSGTLDFSKAAQENARGKGKLAKTLHGDSTEDELISLAREFQISWCLKITPQKFYEGDEGRARLHEAIDNLIHRALEKSPSPKLAELLQNHPKTTEELQLLKTKIDTLEVLEPIPRNKKAAKDLTFAALIFKQFPSPLTADFLKLSVAKPKATKVLNNAAERPDFTALGDDPIHLARGERGFIFPAFTDLSRWGGQCDGNPTWKEYDIAAFKEALKSLNQFKQKTDERAETRKDLEGRIAIMLGGSLENWTPRAEEGSDEARVPDPLPSELLELARALERDLTSRMGDTQVGAEQFTSFGNTSFRWCTSEWKLSRASLRGYSDLSGKWNQCAKKEGDQLSESELQKIVKDYQRDDKNKKNIGSVPLFLALTEKNYWNLWLVDQSSDDSKNEILYDMVKLHHLIRDFQRSLEPINLTPAEARLSRRLYMFSDVGNKIAKVKFTRNGKGQSTFECAIAKTYRGTVQPWRVAIDYSAPRLRRDGLSSDDKSRWLQPMTKALGIEFPESEGAFESAVSLMPDFGPPRKGQVGSELRFLLNFPKTIDSSWLQESLGKKAIWEGQFNGVKEKNLHLHWPATATTKAAKEKPWSKNSAVLKEGFTVLSVDLGQRTAGAWAISKITSTRPNSRRPVHSIGHDGSREWFAEVQNTGMFRLPGEDQKVRGEDGKLAPEPHGSKGRLASITEWQEGLHMAERLLANDPENWLGTTHTQKSFPEQNDALIALANRRLSRLATYHRWSCFDPDRSEVAPRRENMIQTLLSELAHWSDSKVHAWKELIETEKIAEFRQEAGASFKSYRQALQTTLLELANRTVPLRNQEWDWVLRNDGTPYGDLVQRPVEKPIKPKIRGQRGLSMRRLEQLERLRTLFLRYNRAWDREPGTPAKFGRADQGRESGEPCAELLRKIDHLKEQRVNQTAHLIMAQALGVSLREHQISRKERTQKDIHGEYEKIKGREPVDFIAIENLDRYLTSQGRAPSENSRLMKWAHRAVREKLKMLAEDPFGIQVAEAPAAYSSRFCAKTCEPGARCEERSELDPFLTDRLVNQAARPPAYGKPQPSDWQALLDQFEALRELNETQVKGKARTLLLPKPGGPLFLGLNANQPVQADANAAINIGLRAVAAPDALHLIHKIRTIRKGGEIRAVKKNAREKVAFKGDPEIQLKGEASPKLAKASAPNFFYDGSKISDFDQGTLLANQDKIPVASGVGMWATVNTRFLANIIKINKARIKKWRKTSDQIPM